MAFGYIFITSSKVCVLFHTLLLNTYHDSNKAFQFELEYNSRPPTYQSLLLHAEDSLPPPVQQRLIAAWVNLVRQLPDDASIPVI